MATTGSNIRTYLLTKSAITDVIGTRLRPDVLAQSDSLPAATYNELYTTHGHTIGAAAGIEDCMLEITCYSDTRTESDSLADLIRPQLQGYRGTAGSLAVMSCQLDDTGHGYEQPQDDSDQGKHITALRFRIHVEETIPTF